MTIIAQIPVPFSHKHVYLALEEDFLDHEEQVALIDGVSYGVVSRRTEKHDRYQTRGPDAFDAIYESLPQFREIGDGLIRDTTSGCIIY